MPLLSVNNIEVIYDDVILVLKGLSLTVDQGQIVAVLGANGAGKTTTLKAISGLLKTEEGEVTDGAIEFDGEQINHLEPEDIVKRGIFQVMEGRRVFEDLTAKENLIAAAPHPEVLPRRAGKAHRSGLSLLPPPQGARGRPGRLSERRGAADAGDWPGA